MPSAFVERLALLCRDEQRAVTRGVHACGLAHVGEGAGDANRLFVEGRSVLLGTAEVRVVARSGEWLIAPTLVIHYVTGHGYLPPRPFVEAVVAGRVVTTY